MLALSLITTLSPSLSLTLCFLPPLITSLKFFFFHLFLHWTSTLAGDSHWLRSSECIVVQFPCHPETRLPCLSFRQSVLHISEDGGMCAG